MDETPELLEELGLWHALAYAVPPASPSVNARQRLMDRVRLSQPPTNTPPLHFFSKFAHEGEWRDLPIPGISARRLYLDGERRYVTTLLRMAPGASYPRHRHTEPEECYVLEGDLSVGATTYHAGDYQRAETGSIHEVQSSENGCLLLIMASLNDEILA